VHNAQPGKQVGEVAIKEITRPVAEKRARHIGRNGARHRDGGIVCIKMRMKSTTTTTKEGKD
jgi:hypothetical protein